MYVINPIKLDVFCCVPGYLHLMIKATCLASAAEPLILSFKPCYSQELWLLLVKSRPLSLYHTCIYIVFYVKW